MENEAKGLKSLEELETERKTVKNKSRIILNHISLFYYSFYKICGEEKLHCQT